MTVTVLLLPGLLCDAAIWAAQIDELASAYDVRVPDLSAFDSIGAMARSVLDAAPATFSLAGHSMGGRVALDLFARAPERVERLALLDTGSEAARPSEPAARQVLIDLADRAGMAAVADAWLPPMVHPDRRADPAIMPALHAMVVRMSPAILRREIRALLSRPDASGALKLIRCPTLIAVGRQDGWSPPAQHEQIAAAIPHAAYVVFEHCGHMAPVEQPRAVTDALRSWLLTPAG